MEGVTDQEAKIVQYIQEAGKGAILLINKWDLVPKDHKTADAYQKLLLQTYPFLSYIPRVFLSALTGQRVPKIFQWIDQVTAAYSRRVPTSQLNKFFADVLEQSHLPSVS
ncbi:MAG: ribosome biogenesis GTPase Der, partial [Nitrospirae bacterium]|nr:ribosome biogenesis GTPase Der [Nitrospirota bacterium]